jgi:hypothetical protein
VRKRRRRLRLELAGKKAAIGQRACEHGLRVRAARGGIRGCARRRTHSVAAAAWHPRRQGGEGARPPLAVRPLHMRELTAPHLAPEGMDC